MHQRAKSIVLFPQRGDNPFHDLAVGKLDIASPHHLGRLTVFAGVRDLPTRVKCAILPWHTLHAALNSVNTTSTEAEDDPMHVAIGDA